MDPIMVAHIFFGAFFVVLALLGLYVTFLAFTHQLNKNDRGPE